MVRAKDVVAEMDRAGQIWDILRGSVYLVINCVHMVREREE